MNGFFVGHFFLRIQTDFSTPNPTFLLTLLELRRKAENRMSLFASFTAKFKQSTFDDVFFPWMNVIVVLQDKY